MASDRLLLTDFGLNLMAGLVVRGVDTFNTDRPTELHASFCEAFKVVQRKLGYAKLNFVININRAYGTSASVDIILNHWYNSWATKEIPGTVWRLRMNQRAARSRLAKHPEHRELYLQAADAFLQRYHG